MLKFLSIIIFTATTQAMAAEYKQLFMTEHKAGSKEVTQLIGWQTTETNNSKLKNHCKKKYKGHTQCFYYKKKMKLSHIESIKPIFKAIVAAAKTNFFKRVTISVDGSIVEIFDK